MRSMILFTAYTGARSLEGCALQWDWIDFAASTVRAVLSHLLNLCA